MNYKICWICRNSIANSKEHKFKASDIRNIYGNKFDSKVIYMQDEKQNILQGPKDNNLKFSQVICEKCNNSVTQNADKAYSQFISNIHNKFDYFKDSGCFNYKNIYGDKWLINKNDFYRFIGKQIGCRISTFYQSIVPNNLADFVLGKSENKCLKLVFVQKEGIELLRHWSIFNGNGDFTHLANGGIYYHNDVFISVFHGWISYDWLTIHWLCGNIISLNSMNDSREIIYYEKISIEGRNEKIHLIDWIENYNLDTDLKRIQFIRNNCY